MKLATSVGLLALCLGAPEVLGNIPAEAGVFQPVAASAPQDLSGYARSTDVTTAITAAQASTLSQSASTAQTLANAAQSAAQAAIPAFETGIPSSDTVAGAPGSRSTVPRGDAARQRISRSLTVTLASDGTATADWSSRGGALPAPNCATDSTGLSCPTVVLTPIVTTAGMIAKCQLSVLPTTTQAKLKCYVESNAASLSLLGLTSLNIFNQLNGGSPTGMLVGVQAYPPS